MDLLSAAETARRVRAAEGFAGFDHAELERRSGIGRDTIRRLVAKTNPRPASRDELLSIAEACGVPERFMLEGFAPMEEAGLDQRIGAIEQALAGLSTIIAGAVSPERLEAEQRQFLEDWQRRTPSTSAEGEPGTSIEGEG